MYQNFIITEQGYLLHCKIPVEWVACACNELNCYASVCRVCGAIERDCEIPKYELEKINE